MDQNENTTGKSPEQAQNPGLQDSARQAEGPGNMKAESSRKCNICGGPNHQGCGCEAKAAREWPGKDAPPDGQPESEAPADESDDELESILTSEAIVESHKANLKMAQDIKKMADGFEGLCACFYDTNNYLKLIAGDLITIRKLLTKEINQRVLNAVKNQN